MRCVAGKKGKKERERERGRERELSPTFINTVYTRRRKWRNPPRSRSWSLSRRYRRQPIFPWWSRREALSWEERRRENDPWALLSSVIAIPDHENERPLLFLGKRGGRKRERERERERTKVPEESSERHRSCRAATLFLRFVIARVRSSAAQGRCSGHPPLLRGFTRTVSEGG